MSKDPDDQPFGPPRHARAGVVAGSNDVAACISPPSHTCGTAPVGSAVPCRTWPRPSGQPPQDSAAHKDSRASRHPRPPAHRHSPQLDPTPRSVGAPAPSDAGHCITHPPGSPLPAVPSPRDGTGGFCSALQNLAASQRPAPPGLTHIQRLQTLPTPQTSSPPAFPPAGSQTSQRGCSRTQ